MLYIHVQLWHNTNTAYGLASYPAGRQFWYGTKEEIKARLQKLADNVDKITLDKSVNLITINTSERWIMQVSGYSTQRGMYCNVIQA